MRELLGGKGANVAEMTRVLGAGARPGRVHDHHRGVRRLHARRPDRARRASTTQVDEALARLERAGRQAARRRRRPAAGLRPLGRARVDARDARHRPEPRPQRPLGRRAWPSAPRTSASPGTPTGASCRCSATSSRGIAGRALRGRDQGRQAASAASSTTPSSTPTPCASSPTTLPGSFYDFPQEPRDQLEQAIRAVFDSWKGERAVAYRRINRIPDDWGTAVNVQQMVFGNKGDTSGSGVAFSRDEVTGAPEPSRRLPAQRPGRGRRLRRPHPARHRASCADVAARRRTQQLMDILRTLEAHYKDMQDTEFTVEEGRLYMLQTRNAKRPAQAAVRFAVDAVDEGLLTKRGGARDDRRRARSTRCCTRRSTPRPSSTCWRAGVAASPGAAKGEIVFTAADAVAAAERRPRRDPRAPLHRGRRRRGLPRRARASSPARAARPRTRRSWRAGWACPAVDRRRRARRSTSAQRGPRHGDRRPARGRPASRSTARRAASRPTTCRSSSPRSTRTSRRVLGWADELRRARRARERRHPRGRAPGPRARRRGHRPLPHRAHVLRRRPPAEDRAMILADDDEDAPRGARRAAAAPAGRLRGDLRGDGRACR